jgi:hypothetical protein
MADAQGGGAGFAVDEEQLAELFARLVAESGAPLSLDQFLGESESAQLATFVCDAVESGAVVLPVIGGEAIKVELYPNDDAGDLGLILGISPKGWPLWWRKDAQLATHYEDLGEYLDRGREGGFDLGERSMRAALDYVVLRANQLLGLLTAFVAHEAMPGLVQCRCVDPDSDERCGAAADGPDGLCSECRHAGCVSY